MQTASCFVRLLNANGPHKNEAHKAPVTPAEVVILRVIHGDDAVVHLKPLGMDKRAHREELERLRYEYGAKVVNDAFPGHSPTLPVRFADIGVDGVDSAEDDDEGQQPQKPQRKSADANGDGKTTAVELKAALTELGVQFKSNASKAELEKLYADAVAAAAAAAGNGDPAAAAPASDAPYDPAVDGE